MILYEGVTKKREESPINYFCFNCNKVSYHNTCIDCGDKLIYAVKIPKNQRKLQSSADSPLEIKLVCPKCKSSETILTKIGEWVT
ncbi:MAG: hypothetical protein KGD64_03905 [Candidatus Heimdallarchaeota archaeon]|nr:hypothetical protein [Candidatus Heimdallarchaeota archaeon]